MVVNDNLARGVAALLAKKRGIPTGKFVIEQMRGPMGDYIRRGYDKLDDEQKAIVERVLIGDYWQDPARNVWAFAEGVTVDAFGNFTVPTPKERNESREGFGLF